MTHTQNRTNRENILLRLRKIEGQIRGIQRMVEREAECAEILVQVAAVKSAVNRVGALVIRNYLRNCLASASSPTGRGGKGDSIDEWVAIVSKYLE